MTKKEKQILEGLVSAIEGGIEDYNDCTFGWGGARLEEDKLTLYFTPEKNGEQSPTRYRYVFKLQSCGREQNPYMEQS
jgi:hypothetical protein